MARLRNRRSSPKAPATASLPPVPDTEATQEEEQSVEGAPIRLRFNETLTWRAGKPIPVAELLRRLKTLHHELSELEQEDADRDSLVPFAQQLAQRNLLEHKDRGVQVWSALCIVEMFKLLAPDAPFKPSQLKDVFSLVIHSIIPALGNPADPYYEQHLQVVRSLDEVKSIVLLTDIPSADPLLYQLFLTAFDIFADNSANDRGQELSKNVEHHISSLLITVVDESTTLPNDAVDIILAQFLRVDPSTFSLQARKPDQKSLFRLHQIPPAYAMAKNICTSCPDKMARMVSNYFNQIVNHASDDAALPVEKSKKSSHKGKSTRNLDDEDDDDDLARGPSEDELESLRKTHRLLRELWRSSATVIQNIVPQLEAELNAENTNVRMLATETVGDLISGIGAAGPPPPEPLDPVAYPSQSSGVIRPPTKVYDFLTTPSAPHAFSSVHPTSYQHFMNRRHDRSPQIRATWVMCAGRILATSAGGVGLDPQEEEDLLGWVAEMLLDNDERVRLAAVQAVGRCDFYTIVERIGSNGTVTDRGSILFNLADRIKDRRHSVRVEAMTLLGRIWGVAAGAITEGNETVRSLLGAIPSRIFQAIYINDVEINSLVEQVLADSLLPLAFPPIKKEKSSTNGDSQRVKDSQNPSAEGDKPLNPDSIRAERILVLVRDLEDKAKTVFFALQTRQTSMAKYLDAFLKQCEAYNGGVTKKGDNEASDRLAKLIDLFAKRRPEPITAGEHLWKFAKKHDRRCYQLIRFAISPDSDYKKVYNAYKELSKRIEESSNSAMLVTLLPTVRQASVLVYNKSHVPTILDFARSEGRGLENAAHDVLKQISEQNPEVFKAHVRTLCTELERQVPSPGSPSDPGVVETLKACAGFAQRYPAEIPRSRDFLHSMVQFALYGSPSVAAKHAVSVVVAADEKRDMYIKDIVTNCTTDFQYGAEGFLSKLASLSQLMLLSAKDIEEEHDTILQIAIQDVLMQVRQKATEEDPSWKTEMDDECAAKVWALKILANRLRSYASSIPDSEMDIIVTQFAPPVFKLLNSIIKGDGEISKKEPTPTHHRAHLRLTAAILLLKLCGSHKRLEAAFSPAEFNRLTVVVQDALPEVRAAFVTRVKKHLGQARLPPRFYALVFMLAYEPNTSIKDNTVTWLRGRAAAFAKTGNSVMEATFARFLSLLAHHPDFSMELENLQDFVEYIMFYLKTVASQSNVALIFHVAQRLKGVQDGIDEAMSDNLYTLSDIAQAVIKSFADAQGWSIATYSGKLRLPAGLFTQLPNHTVAQQISEKIYAPEELIEKVDDLVRTSMRTKKRKPENTGNATKKRVRTSESRPIKALPVRKAAKPKQAKTPKKRVARESSASAGVTPSTEVRRSTRGSRTTDYTELDDSDDDEELEEWNQEADADGAGEGEDEDDEDEEEQEQEQADEPAQDGEMDEQAENHENEDEEAEKPPGVQSEPEQQESPQSRAQTRTRAKKAPAAVADQTAPSTRPTRRAAAAAAATRASSKQIAKPKAKAKRTKGAEEEGDTIAVAGGSDQELSDAPSDMEE